MFNDIFIARKVYVANRDAEFPVASDAGGIQDFILNLSGIIDSLGECVFGRNKKKNDCYSCESRNPTHGSPLSRG